VLSAMQLLKWKVIQNRTSGGKFDYNEEFCKYCDVDHKWNPEILNRKCRHPVKSCIFEVPLVHLSEKRGTSNRNYYNCCQIVLSRLWKTRREISLLIEERSESVVVWISIVESFWTNTVQYYIYASGRIACARQRLFQPYSLPRELWLTGMR
jgi:hypothetical protein